MVGHLQWQNDAVLKEDKSDVWLPTRNGSKLLLPRKRLSLSLSLSLFIYEKKLTDHESEFKDCERTL